MSEILDNINDYLLPRLQKTLEKSYKADFCVAYFNLYGWQNLDAQLDNQTGEDPFKPSPVFYFVQNEWFISKVTNND